MRSAKRDVDLFLSDVKNAIRQKNYTPIDRDKNLNTLAQLGITWKDAIDEINELSFSNYIKGPEIDRDFPQHDHLWVFKKGMMGETIYIKLKILYQNNKSLLVLSFHIDEP
ncbi:MAG: type II toxin-antitoxin system MqsR family toxin [Clostridia bacterium]|nr:type II toxin-antitoxin system MqsR family toxin [Clostridia bacterium]